MTAISRHPIRFRTDKWNTWGEIVMDTGVDFRAIRKRLGLSQAEFAEALGVSRQYVSRLETGDATEASETLCRLALMYERHGYSGNVNPA